MAISENKRRITISLTKETLELLKKSANDNLRTLSNEVESILIKTLVNKK